jgi:enoyl-CoA hydratase/carnithine racemase
MWNISGDLTAEFVFLPEYFACVCLNCDNDAASIAPCHSDRASLGWSSAIQPQSAAHGASIGWGCTQFYAHPAAFFQTPFMPLGFVPTGGSSYTFPKPMGKQQANALLAGDRLSAQEMYDAGLVTAVVPSETPAEFLEKMCEKTKRIAGFNAESLGMAKALMKATAGVAKGG